MAIHPQRALNERFGLFSTTESYIRMCEPLGGGWTSTGGAFLAATYMRKPLRLAKGVSAME